MKFVKIILIFLFVFIGLVLAFFTTKKNDQVKFVDQEKEQASDFKDYNNKIWQEQESSSSGQLNNTNKYTIFAKTKIVSDREKAQTGEEVKFSTVIINKGKTKKFLTHVCFNHSGGVTFGCVLGINLDPEQEFPLSGTTKFLAPGNYSVSLTWSQDKTNFYPVQDQSFRQILIN